MKKIESLSDLSPDPRNPRRHPERNISQIERSLEQLGAARSIVIDENGTVMAGNGVVEAAANVGINRVIPVEASGNEIVAVVRRGLTDEQKRKLAVADNRTAELSEWDPAIVLELGSEIDLSDQFFQSEMAELEAMIEAGDLDTNPSEAGRQLQKRIGAGGFFLKLVVSVRQHQAVERIIQAVQDKYNLDRGDAFVKVCELAREAGQFDFRSEDSAAA
jgi:hypothetical protein